MKPLLEYCARTRALVEGAIPLDEITRNALKRLVEYTLASIPDTGAVSNVRSKFTLYVHPNGRCCITLEPDDMRSPYYEWRRVYESWALYNRHCWKADALRIAEGPIRTEEGRRGPTSSRPPPSPVPPRPPSVEIMPLEEQIRQVLLVDKDRGEYVGTTASAVRCLETAGFDLGIFEVQDALWKVTRGTAIRVLDPTPST